MNPRKIYLASSWRNEQQPAMVGMLRKLGHEVYDFRNPSSGNSGFSWSEISPSWQKWKPEEFRKALQNPIAKKGFSLDFQAMFWADTFLLLLPCGRSAHLEAGWAIGAGKSVGILLDDKKNEPELMYKLTPAIFCKFEEVADWLRSLA